MMMTAPGGAIKDIRMCTYRRERLISAQRLPEGVLSKKDIVSINREFHAGKVVNDSSLDFALDLTQKSRNWLKTAAVLTRAILIDHAFEDGNKRTAAAVILALADMNGVCCNPDRVNAAIVRMLLRNITDIRAIERLIKNAIE